MRVDGGRMATNSERRTFISYSRVNGTFAIKLATELKIAGYSVWLDQLDIPTGARWDDEITISVNGGKEIAYPFGPDEDKLCEGQVGIALTSDKDFPVKVNLLSITISNP
jgi:hypothetical protein